MKLKIPPALQVLIFVLLMYGMTKLFGKHFTFEYQKTMTSVVFYLGVLIGLIAVFSFQKAKTTVDPTNPAKATHLVTYGIYRYTRNPMYLGMLLVLIAIFLKLGNYFNIAIVILYVWYITSFQIRPEEKVLTEIFGDDFTNYCKKVRRWI